MMSEKIGIERPFRHLCSEADLRDAMDDGEFWDHVFSGHEPEPDYEWDQDVETAIGGICDTCGSSGACGYDAEGRPWIHCSEEE